MTTTSPRACGPTAPRSGSSRTATAPTMPSTPTTSETGERVEEREFELDRRRTAPHVESGPNGETFFWVSDSGQRHGSSPTTSPPASADARTATSCSPRDRNRRPRAASGPTVRDDVGSRRGQGRCALRLRPRERASCSQSTNSTTPTATRAASGPTASASGSPTTSPSVLFAYRLPSLEDAAEDTDSLELERVRDEEFTRLSRASNNSPRGLWSDGEVMYVADASDDKVYSYNMPDAIDARLASLRLSGIEIGEFSPPQPVYEGVVAPDVTETTVEAVAVQSGAGGRHPPARHRRGGRRPPGRPPGPRRDQRHRDPRPTAPEENTYRVSFPEVAWESGPRSLATLPARGCLRGLQSRRL